MQRWRDLTLGDLLDGLARYRPFALTLLGILLLAIVLPGSPRPSGDIAVGSIPAPAHREGAAQSAAEANDSRADAGSLRADASRAPLPQSESAAPERAAAAAASTVEDVSTDALTAPDCDPATGRIKAPSWYIVFAPNCVPIWPKGRDNGAATYRGVTADTITVAIYVPAESTNTQQAQAIFAATGYEDPTSDEEDDVNRQKVVDAYEAHFETYGRKVKWVKLQASGPANDDTAAKADAVRVATEIKAFASLNDPSNAGGGIAYIEELAARGVMCIGCTPGQPQHNFLRWDPHVFSTEQNSNQLMLHVAEYTGKQLGNKPAKFAGDPLTQTQTRRLGLIQYNTVDNTYDGNAAFLDGELQKYGLKLAVVVEYVLDLSAAQEQSRVMIAKMKDQGINTLMFYGDPLTPIFLTQEATNQQYFPEWFSAAGPALDLALLARTYDQTQWAHAYGLFRLPARVDPDELEREGNLVSWHHGGELDSYPHMVQFGMLYQGIHLAGPKLTAEAFRDGMFSLKPTSGYITRQAVSYGTHLWPWRDFHAIDDLVEAWWDANATGPDELGAYGRGMYRYVDMGIRSLWGTRPVREPKLFDTADTVMLYDTRPPQDLLPEYEHKHYRGQ